MEAGIGGEGGKSEEAVDGRKGGREEREREPRSSPDGTCRLKGELQPLFPRLPCVLDIAERTRAQSRPDSGGCMRAETNVMQLLQGALC
eukprot:1995326-Rhodomonas_salina.2